MTIAGLALLSYSLAAISVKYDLNDWVLIGPIILIGSLYVTHALVILFNSDR